MSMFAWPVVEYVCKCMYACMILPLTVRESPYCKRSMYVYMYINVCMHDVVPYCKGEGQVVCVSVPRKKQISTDT